MNDRFPVVLVAGLAVLGLLGVVVMRSANRGEFAETLSTYRSAHDGARALYVLLQRDGVRVQRLVEDLETLEAHDTVALLGLAIDDTSQSASDAGVTTWSWGDDDASTLHEKDVERLLEHTTGGATVVAVLADAKQNALLDALEVWVEHDDEISGLRTLVPGQPTAFTTGVQRVEATVDAYLHAPATAVPVLVDEVNDEPVALWVPHGEGGFLLISSKELASNTALTRADNAQWWRSAFAGDGVTAARVVFDEYHHGFTNERSAGQFAARYGLHVAAAQVLLGVVVWALSLRRFGKPRRIAEAQRLTTADTLAATSHVYREGRHVAHAASAVATQLVHEASSRADRTSLEHVAADLTARGLPEAASALRHVAGLAAAATTEADLLAVARAAALARRRLTHRTTP